jgi:hypothetical protein
MPTSERTLDPGLALELRKLIAPSEGPSSIALLDWTSLHHARRLLEGSLEWALFDEEVASMASTAWRMFAWQQDESERRVDPFVALADLASVVSAVILYDRVVFLGTSSEATRINDGDRRNSPPSISELPHPVSSGLAE